MKENFSYENPFPIDNILREKTVIIFDAQEKIVKTWQKKKKKKKKKIS